MTKKTLILYHRDELVIQSDEFNYLFCNMFGYGAVSRTFLCPFEGIRKCLLLRCLCLYCLSELVVLCVHLRSATNCALMFRKKKKKKKKALDPCSKLTILISEKLPMSCRSAQDIPLNIFANTSLSLFALSHILFCAVQMKNPQFYHN